VNVPYIITRTDRALLGLLLLCVVSATEAHSDTNNNSLRSFEEAFSAGMVTEALSIAKQDLAVDINRDPLAVADHLLNVGRALVALRQPNEAIKYLRQASDLSQENYQKARISNQLAKAFMLAGNAGEAVRRYVDLIKFYSDAGASATGELAQNLCDLGNLQRELGRLDEAESLLQRSLLLREESFGGEHPDVAASVLGLGNVLWQRGKYLEAKPLYERAIAILDRPALANHPSLATALNNLGSTLVELGKFSDALILHKRALGIREIALGPDNYDVSVSLNNIGNAYRELGQLFESEATLRKALAIREQWETPNGASVTTVLNNLALAYAAMNREEEAERLYGRAIEILQDRSDAGLRGLGQIFSNLGRLYLSSGKDAKAAKTLHRAYDVSVATRPPKHHEIATALNFLALAESRTGQYDEAISHLEEGLAIREQALGRAHPHTAISRTRLGQFLYDKGLNAEAEAQVRQAVEILQGQLGPDNPETAEAMRQLGSLLIDRDELAGGLTFLGEAAAAYARIEAFDFARFQSLDHIASKSIVYRELVRAAWLRWGNVPRVNFDLETGFSAAQAISRTIASAALAQMSARFGSEGTRLGMVVRATQDLSERRNAIDRRLFAAIAPMEGSRDELLVSTLRKELGTVEQDLQFSSEHLRTEFPDYAAFARPDPLTTAQVAENLTDHEALITYLTLPKSERTDESTFIWVVTRDAVRWSRVSMGASTLSDKVAALRCGLDSEEWEGIGRPARCGRLLGMRMRPRVSDPLPFHLGIAQELYQALLGPVEDMIKDKHLLIVPSGPLTSLPFQVLVSAPPASAKPKTFDGYRGVAWLGRRQPLTILPSVASLQALRRFAKESTAERPYLGYGAPVLMGDGACRQSTATQACTPVAKRFADDPMPARERSEARSGSIDRIYRKGGPGQEAVIAEVRMLCPLPDTAFELRCVSKSLGVPESEIRLGSSSTEADIKRLSERHELENYRVVHFATHGLLAGDTEAMARRQGQPALVMTPPEHPVDADDDGLLTASEIAQLRLNADWVILSACNTAAGDKLGAEALSGLARAFFYAGARALLVSHWPVYSDAAVQLLDQTFAELRQDRTIGRSEALRRAMIVLMDDPRQEDNPHPSIWAPFSLVGEGGK
jgi:tetratricopeptide (TPR) repeat protein/CHAT domain-containing protein